MADFPLATFRLIYPAFELTGDDVVLATAQTALCYTSERGCGCTEAMWMLMVAHLLFLAGLNTQGQFTPGMLASTSIDKVSVSFALPTQTTPWAFWLNRSPYGQQFAALLAKCSAVGFYVGGAPERAAFRTVGGVFPGRGGLGWRR